MNTLSEIKILMQEYNSVSNHEHFCAKVGDVRETKKINFPIRSSNLMMLEKRIYCKIYIYIYIYCNKYISIPL